MSEMNEENERILPSALLGGWMPIETAPTDGTEVLLYQENAGIQVSWFGYDVDNMETGWFRFNPTHWMHLPKPPNT